MSTSSKRTYTDHLLSVGIFLLVVATFIHTAKLDFIKFDDYKRVVENHYLQRGLTPTTLRWAFAAGHEGDYNPLTWISHMIDFRLFGHAPAGHHAANVFYHALASVFCFLGLRTLTTHRFLSLVVTLLFALHPLRAESVAWISERKDVLLGVFWMLTLWTYGNYARNRTWRRYGAVSLALAGALLAKPMAITLPFLLLLLDFWPLQRPMATVRNISALIAEKIPFFLMSAILTMLSYQATHVIGAVISDLIPFSTRLENALLSYVRYIGKYFWPMKLSAYYPYPTGDIFWPAIAAAIGLLLTTVAIILLASRRRYLAVGWFWYLGTLLPVIGLIQAGHQAMADRYTYVTQIGLSIMLVWGVNDLLKRDTRKRWQPVAIATVTALLMICTVLTWRQCRHWQNGITLFSQAIINTPDNYFAYSALGASLDMNGRSAEAIEAYRKSLELNPTYASAHYNWANALIHLGRTDEAIGHYQRAAEMQADALTFRNWGAALNLRGEYESAYLISQKGLDLAPTDDALLVNLGVISFNLGRYEEAFGYYERAHRINPLSAAAHQGMGVAALQLGRFELAAKHAQSALTMAPDMWAARLCLGTALAETGQLKDAMTEFRRTVVGAQASGNVAIANEAQRRLTILFPPDP
ncbi:MAG: tetratricopeptide repeat protein [Verrucomicrobia bacterium]|nr:tetratricopeptide repeat protein [Verrucomicrobiota bacterium]